DFLPKRPVIILVHGYRGHRDAAPNNLIRPALLANEQVYVISVDYGPLAQKPCYKEAIGSTPLVSKCLAQLIDNLVNLGIIDNNFLHLIGFSLGAHVAGQTSNYVNQTLYHITGLDPAKPYFAVANDTYRLTADDAYFVDVIHTNPPQRGILKPMGHADFYVNFRQEEQPGCERAETAGSCSHHRASEYYAASIEPNKGFWGIRCDSWKTDVFGRCANQQARALMGYHAVPTKRGVYFLETYAKYPYAAGQKGALITDRAKQLIDKIAVQ
ncbi:hypothetical protein KR044_004945, partial [Drosophila immigrans]